MPATSDWLSPNIVCEYNRLERPGFAAEFLRRSPLYHADYTRTFGSVAAGEDRALADLARRWGFLFPFDPAAPLDHRNFIWRPELLPTAVVLAPTPTSFETARLDDFTVRSVTAWNSFGDAVKHVVIRERDGTSQPYLFIENEAVLMICVQMGTIEFHGWGSRIKDVEKADRLVFDLDPDEGLDFQSVKDAAFDFCRALDGIGCRRFQW